MSDLNDERAIADAIEEGAAAICRAEHRTNQSAAEPPCGTCFGISETVIRAALPRLLNRDVPDGR